MARAKKEYSEIDGIREDLESLRSNVGELTKRVKRNGYTQSAEFKHMAAERWKELKNNSQHRVEDLERKVKEKPAQSVAMAFVAGALTSFLFRQR